MSNSIDVVVTIKICRYATAGFSWSKYKHNYHPRNTTNLVFWLEEFAEECKKSGRNNPLTEHFEVRKEAYLADEMRDKPLRISLRDVEWGSLCSDMQDLSACTPGVMFMCKVFEAIPSDNMLYVYYNGCEAMEEPQLTWYLPDVRNFPDLDMYQRMDVLKAFQNGELIYVNRN